MLQHAGLQNPESSSIKSRSIARHATGAWPFYFVTRVVLLSGFHHRLAADEPCELAQPHEHALAGERLEAVLEAQHQTATLDRHRSLREDAGSRSRDQISDTQCGAEHTRAIEHTGRGKLAQPWRKL